LGLSRALMPVNVRPVIDRWRRQATRRSLGSQEPNRAIAVVTVLLQKRTSSSPVPALAVRGFLFVSVLSQLPWVCRYFNSFQRVHAPPLFSFPGRIIPVQGRSRRGVCRSFLGIAAWQADRSRTGAGWRTGECRHRRGRRRPATFRNPAVGTRQLGQVVERSPALPDARSSLPELWLSGPRQ
jgi:hypothetical protein